MKGLIGWVSCPVVGDGASIGFCKEGMQPLTPKGRRQPRVVVNLLECLATRELGVKSYEFSRIFSSGWIHSPVWFGLQPLTNSTKSDCLGDPPEPWSSGRQVGAPWW